MKLERYLKKQEYRLQPEIGRLYLVICVCLCMCFDWVLLLSCSLICLPIFYSSLYNCKSLFKDLMKAFSSFLCSFFFLFLLSNDNFSLIFWYSLPHSLLAPFIPLSGVPCDKWFWRWMRLLLLLHSSSIVSHWVFTRSCSSPLASVFCFNRIGSSIMSFLSWSPLLPRSFCLCTLHPLPKKGNLNRTLNW